MGGGGMLRTATAAVGAAPTASNNLPILPPLLSSSNSSFPISGNYADSVCPGGVCRCKRGGGRADGSFIDRVLGLVPSRFEVENAITALQSFLLGISSSGSESDQRMIQTQRYSRVYEAFRLLQTDSAVQRMVVSLALDKAVWDAVLNNKMVRKLWEPLYPGIHGAEEETSKSSEELDLGAHILRWILEITKVKIMELVEKFQSLVNEVFRSSEDEGSTTEGADQLDEKIVSSTFLAIVILLIVVVTRAGCV